MRFLFESKTDGVTLTATSGAIANVQSNPIAMVWQSEDTASQEIKADLGQSESINIVHLENINASADTEYVLDLSDDDFDTFTFRQSFNKWSNDLHYKSATLWPSGAYGGETLVDNSGTVLADSGGDELAEATLTFPSTARYVRLTVVDPDNSDGYMEIGRLMVGAYYEAENSPNVSINKSFEYRERAAQIETRGGAIRAQNKAPQRKIGVEYEHLHETDATEIEDDSLVEYIRTVGRRNDILISVYPEDGDDRERLHTMVGRVTRRSEIRGDYMEGGTPKLRSRLSFEVTETL